MTPRRTDVRDRGTRYTSAAVLAAVVAAVVLWDFAFASRSFFFGDDIVTFWQGKVAGLSLDYLTTPIVGGHFSPGVRMLSYAVQRLVPFDWDAALALGLAFQAIAVVLVQRTLAALFGGRWWTFLLALAFGVSVILMARLAWFSAAIQAIPAIAFSLACLHGYVWWWRTRRPAWLAWSVAALCLALGFYESAVLVPVSLVLLRLLLLRAPPRVLAREWRVWLLYAAPVVALIVVVVAGDYETGGSPQLSFVPDYLWHAWMDGFAPAVFGVRVPLFDQTAAHHVAVWGAQVAIVAAVVLSVVRRRSAWRAWAFLAGSFLLNALLLLPRLQVFGPGLAFDTRYYGETAYLVPFALAFAFATPRARDGGVEPAHADRQPARERADASAPRRVGAPPATGVAVALAAYLALVAWGDTQTVDALPGRKVAPWVDRVQAGLAAARTEDARPALLDGPVPDAVVGGFFTPPASYLSAVVPLFDPAVRFNVAAPHVYRVTPDGDLRQVAFVPASSRPTRRCAGGGARIRLQPPQPLRGRGLWLKAAYRSDVPLGVVPNVGAGYRRADLFGLPAAPRGATGLVRMSTPPGTATVVGAEIVVPLGARACVTAGAFGTFRDR